MTVAELKEHIKNENFGGIKVLNNKQLESIQRRVFEQICELCEPVNLVVSSSNEDIYKALDDGWFLKKPTIAKRDSEHIDIDSRLDMAFVDMVISFITNDPRQRLEYEQRAYGRIVNYAIEVEKMGYSKAKETYEEFSFVSGVRYDCEYRYYDVDSRFVDLVIGCILKKDCSDLYRDGSDFLKKYRSYIDGTLPTSYKEKFQAVDREVYKRLMCNGELVANHSSEELKKVTTLFCEYAQDERSEFAKKVDRDLGR